MQLLFIHARNSAFVSHDDGAEYDNPETALRLGVKTAADLLADEINRGERSAAIEISIEQKDGTQVLRSVVAISVSPLLPEARLAKPNRSSTGHD